MGARARDGGAVLEARRPELLVALAPLVAGFAADPELPTELGKALVRFVHCRDEAKSFVHCTRLFPGHRVLRCGALFRNVSPSCPVSALSPDCRVRPVTPLGGLYHRLRATDPGP